MERQTKTIKTPVAKQEIVLKDWITGRESEYISGPMFDSVAIDAKAGSPEIKASNFSAQMIEGNHRAITTVVVSIDGSVDNILNKVLDEMTQDDYGFIMAEIEKVTKKKEVQAQP